MRPWDRRETESALQYGRFCHYLNSAEPGTGKRSMKALAREMGEPEGRLRTVCTKYDWISRARAYDAKREEESRAMAESEEEARDVLPRAVKAMRRAVDKLMKSADELAPGDIVKLVDALGKLSKLEESGAENATIPAPPDKRVDLSGLSDEELVSFDELLKKIRLQ